MGVRFPLPAPSNLFVSNMLQGREVSEANPPVQIRYTAHPIYFQWFTVSKYDFGVAISYVQPFQEGIRFLHRQYPRLTMEVVFAILTEGTQRP